jgi:hypothetical protein
MPCSATPSGAVSAGSNPAGGTPKLRAKVPIGPARTGITGACRPPPGCDTTRRALTPSAPHTLPKVSPGPSAPVDQSPAQDDQDFHVCRERRSPQPFASRTAIPAHCPGNPLTPGRPARRNEHPRPRGLHDNGHYRVDLPRPWRGFRAGGRTRGRARSVNLLPVHSWSTVADHAATRLRLPQVDAAVAICARPPRRSRAPGGRQRRLLERPGCGLPGPGTPSCAPSHRRGRGRNGR